jgi:restriction system protein
LADGLDDRKLSCSDPDRQILRIDAGQAQLVLRTATEGVAEGDLVLAPKPDRTYQYGVVTGGYEYFPGTELPHRRPSTGRARSTGTT